MTNGASFVSMAALGAAVAIYKDRGCLHSLTVGVGIDDAPRLIRLLGHVVVMASCVGVVTEHNAGLVDENRGHVNCLLHRLLVSAVDCPKQRIQLRDFVALAIRKIGRVVAVAHTRTQAEF